MSQGDIANALEASRLCRIKFISRDQTRAEDSILDSLARFFPDKCGLYVYCHQWNVQGWWVKECIFIAGVHTAASKLEWADIGGKLHQDWWKKGFGPSVQMFPEEQQQRELNLEENTMEGRRSRKFCMMMGNLVLRMCGKPLAARAKDLGGFKKTSINSTSNLRTWRLNASSCGASCKEGRGRVNHQA
jgi:hypothetical protein